MARPRTPKRAETYKHEEEALLRPEVGTQAQFKKRKPPKTYTYDSSLSPALDWDGQKDPLEEVKAQAAQRWVDAVNADGSFGEWRYAIAHEMAGVANILDAVSAAEPTAIA